MKNEKRKKSRWILGFIAGAVTVAIWIVVILDINVWRHLTGAAASVDWIVAIFLSVALAYFVAGLK